MRLRLPLGALATGIAAVVGAALAASPPAARGAAALASSVHSYTSAGLVPSGFQPGSFTATSDLDWWLLGTAPCGRHSCTAIVRTEDGGAHFTRIPAPPSTAVSGVRFATASDGYAYGRQLWSTRDGGRRWAQQLHLGTAVDDLQTADGRAYALVFSHGRGSLLRSAVGSDAWKALSGVGSGYLSGLWVQGSTVIIQAGGRLFVSSDQGAHFRRVRGVQRAGNCSYDAVTPPSVIWALCSTGMAPDDILLSTDSGQAFTTAAQVPNGPIDAFAAASSSVAVASGQGPLYRTANGGASWSAVAAPSAGWSYLGFTDPIHGVAIGNFGTDGHQDSRLYYTTDAGGSYHRVAIR